MNFLNLNKIYTFQIAIDGTVMLLSTIWVIIRNLQNYFKPRQDKTRIISLAKQAQTNIHTKNKQTDIQTNKQSHTNTKKERKKQNTNRQTNKQTCKVVIVII